MGRPELRLRVVQGCTSYTVTAGGNTRVWKTVTAGGTQVWKTVTAGGTHVWKTVTAGGDTRVWKTLESSTGSRVVISCLDECCYRFSEQMAYFPRICFSNFVFYSHISRGFLR